MMSSNCFSLVSRPCTLIGSWKGTLAPSGTGGWPMRPAATWMFCSLIARITSLAVICSAASLFGSSQTRML